MPPDEEEGMFVLFQCFLSLPDLEIQLFKSSMYVVGQHISSELN